MPVTIGETPHRYAHPQQQRLQRSYGTTEYNEPYFTSNYVEDGDYEEYQDFSESDVRINANNCNQPLDHLELYEHVDDDAEADVAGDQGMAATTSGGVTGHHQNRRVSSWHGMTSSNWDESDDARRVASEPYFNDPRNRNGMRTEVCL